MARYYSKRTRGHRFRIFLLVCAAIILILVVATVAVFNVYNQNLKPVSNNPKTQTITVNTGDSVKQIADLLHQAGLIKSSWAFQWYVRSKELRADLQAGTYSLSPSDSVQKVVAVLTQGKVATNLVTIYPDKRLDQIRSDLINDGFSPAAVDAALQPGQYSGLPALAYKPSSASLEGFIYPDSFQRTETTDPSVIIRESLTEMGKHLTPSLQAAFAKEGLSTYQGIILASIVQQEVPDAPDQAQAAQVFLKRISLNMPLGSDQTAFYGAIVAGQTPSVSYDSPYNTLIRTGWPPTPISNVNDQALNAAAHPASTNWLYFVTGDNGTTYFEQTAQQHQADINQYCHVKCAQDSK